MTLMHAGNENHCIRKAKLAGDQQFQVVREEYNLTLNFELLFLEREMGTFNQNREFRRRTRLGRRTADKVSLRY